ncbi:MAG: DUF1080 domain-containing protein [Sedimentisphaerales bacterium]|nr:DUF1080 domain-containing protein [Sedimentisphaerales bacterium]
MKGLLRHMSLFLLAGILLPTGWAAGEESWQDLFDGKTLNGWVQRNGQARYEVVDGVIVGTTVAGTPNSFLCTEKDYGDFILELEFWVDPALNSGIQIRSESRPDFKNGRVHGYQVEIDPSARAWSGGIYDEARRGWLFDLKDRPAAQQAFRQNQWNHYRIEAIGDRMRTWVNGVPAADLKDDMTRRGFIALQVHSDPKSGLQVKWRNIRLQDLDRAGAARPLAALIVDGQNNHNWKATSPVLEAILAETGLFRVEVATTPPAGQPMADFQPDFSQYDVVVLNYTGDDWPEVTRQAFVRYVENGGGVVVFHAADNAFAGWKEFNEIIGLGGWGGRNERSGPYVYWRDGNLVRDTSPGGGGAHGQANPFPVTIRDGEHPITQGLPARWLHAKDELYSRLRGPARNLILLATGFQPTEQGGTGREEPVLFTISYGSGRIFHTVLGHDPYSMSCVGFAVTLQRGAEWAATGKVTRTEVPKDFPTAERISVRPELARIKPAIRVPTDQIINWQFDRDRSQMMAMEEALRGASPSQLQQVESQLLAVLDSPQATYAGKQYVCRLLRQIGTRQCVAALARLLDDKKLSHMARFALQFNPSDEAGDALRAALGRIGDIELKIGLVGSLGARRDRQAAGQIAGLIGSANPALAQAALRALGDIGGDEAAAALARAQVRPDLQLLKDDAYLRCADGLAAEGKKAAALEIYRQMSDAGRPTMIRVAASRGLILADPRQASPVIVAMLKDADAQLRQAAAKFIAELPEDPQTTASLVKLLGSLETPGQVMLLEALEKRADKTAAAEVARFAAAGDEAVRVQAIQALAVLGGAEVVDMLAQMAARSDAAGRAAFESLTRLDGPRVDAALQNVIAGKQNPAVRARVIEAAAVRGDLTSLAALTAAARDQDANVRRAAYKALGELGQAEQIAALTELLAAVSDGSERGELERALTAVARRAVQQGGNPDALSVPLVARLERADADARGRLINALPQIGGARALEALRTQLRGGTDKTTVIRALANWPDAAPLADLLGMAKGEADLTGHVLALRGYVRLASQASGADVATQQQRFEAAMDAARRPDEKKLILGAVAKSPAPWSLEFAGRFRDDPALKAEATAAYQEIFAAINKMTVVDPQGELKAKEAAIHGSGAAYEPGANRDCIGMWNNKDAWVSWDLVIMQAGEYEVIASQSMADTPGNPYRLEIAGQTLSGTVRSTGDWGRFVPVPLGKVKIAEPGTYCLSVKPEKVAGTYVMNLRSVTLKKTD